MGRLGTFWLFLAAFAVQVGCAGKNRDFADEPSAPASTGESTGTAGETAASAEGTPGAPGSSESGLTPLGGLAAPAGAALGTACARGFECASGFCVDGVCCDTRCGEICATCAAPGQEGTCSAAASDEGCGALACAGGTECRGYDQTQLEQNCAALGECRTGIECAALDQPEGTPCQASTGACNGLGECVVPGKALLGAACTSDDECGEGHCVVGADGSSICCDSACDGLCQQCSGAGRCVEAPPSDARCAAVDCPDDNVCRDFADSLDDNLCRGFGQCRTALDCPWSALRAESSCECDASGACSLARGQRCAADAECGAASCAPSLTGETICCAAACGPGLSCSSDGSRCVECEGDGIRCDGNAELRCNGETLTSSACEHGCTPGIGCNTLAPVGFACDAVDCQGDAVCQADVLGARRCCSRDCAAEGKVCAENGSCVCPQGVTQAENASCLLQQGDPCGPATTACEAGLSCVDGVCCAEACGGACESCNVPGSVGQCVFAPQDTGLCALGEQCVARGQCRLENGETCSGNDARCVSSNCEPQRGAAGSTLCCGEACSTARPFCSSDGARCVQCETNADCPNGCQNGTCLPLRELGDLCDVASQCTSGVCTRINGTSTSRCCGNCSGGQVCNASGGCECPPNQTLIAGQCRKIPGQTCQNGSECTTSNCETAVDGANRCCAADCGNPNISRCAQDGSGCIDQRGGVGATCTAGADCQSGNCADGVCCSEPCDGVCERCNAPGQQGQCVDDATGTSCNNGFQCVGRGVCRPGIGGSCSSTPCGEGTCIETTRGGARVCCADDCAEGLVCASSGTSCAECGSDDDCPDACVNGSCVAADGSPCAVNADCASGSCVRHYADADNDGFAAAGTPATLLCASNGPARAGTTTREPEAPNTTDCCEGDASTFPGAAPGRGLGLATPNECASFDYNCDGRQASGEASQNRIANCSAAPVATCSRDGNGFNVPPLPACGAAGDFQICGGTGVCAEVNGVPGLVRVCL